MRQHLHRLIVETHGQGLVEITAAIKDWLANLHLREGLLTAYCRHTSASLLIQENADPDVCQDLQTFFAKIAPEGRGLYVHESEGPDDMPAHIRAALTQTQFSIPVADRKLVLGTWQGIYLFEHRRAPHRREIVLHVIGE
jgi:secondary thiamine-phosphate synthase enzyme